MGGYYCDTNTFGSDAGWSFTTCYQNSESAIDSIGRTVVTSFMKSNNVCLTDGSSNTPCSSIFHFAYENKNNYIECGSIPNCSGKAYYNTKKTTITDNTVYLNVSDNKLTIS